MFTRTLVSALVLAVAGILIAASGTAWAQTASANFNVTATVINRCTISAANLAFGNYDPTSGAPLPGQSDLTVSCTRGHTAWIGLNDGQNFSAGSRRMLGNVDQFLPYGLYVDAGHSTPWGNTQPTGYTYLSAGRAPQPVTIYGQVPAGTDLTAGSFTDTVQATINF